MESSTLNIEKIRNKEDIPYQLLLLADPSRESIDEYLERGEVYAAKRGGAIVGVYVIIKTRPFTMELVNVAVDEALHGQGIGKLLIMDSIQRVREEGVKTFEVGTGNSSIGQLALYQKCGFRIKFVEQDYFKKYYPEDIVENGIHCVDMIRLAIDF